MSQSIIPCSVMSINGSEKHESSDTAETAELHLLPTSTEYIITQIKTCTQHNNEEMNGRKSNDGVLVCKTNKNDVVLHLPLMLRVSEETPPQIVAPRRPLPMGMASVQFREGPANVSFRGLERSWPSINVLPDERRTGFLPPSQHVIVIISMRRRMVKWTKKLDFSAIATTASRERRVAFTREDIEREREVWS